MSYLDRLKRKISGEAGDTEATKATKAPFVPFVAPVAGPSGEISGPAANDKAASPVPLPAGIAPEDFEERAAIAEFDGGMPRDEAEAFALADLADDRIRCTACMNRRPYDGVCKAAMVEFPASRGYVPDPVLLRRCEGFKPKPGDPDQRDGRER